FRGPEGRLVSRELSQRIEEVELFQIVDPQTTRYISRELARSRRTPGWQPISGADAIIEGTVIRHRVERETNLASVIFEGEQYVARVSIHFRIRDLRRGMIIADRTVSASADALSDLEGAALRGFQGNKPSRSDLDNLLSVARNKAVTAFTRSFDPIYDDF
ncbi:MAG: hypothetical protein AAGF99_16840, partial [Bacteroidota bacterium]